jgi:hypothetical protein
MKWKKIDAVISKCVTPMCYFGLLWIFVKDSYNSNFFLGGGI